jgi:hypothetical protein
LKRSLDFCHFLAFCIFFVASGTLILTIRLLRVWLSSFSLGKSNNLQSLFFF